MRGLARSFGVPIVAEIENGTGLQELQESIGRKLSEVDVGRLPTLRNRDNEERAKNGEAS